MRVEPFVKPEPETVVKVAVFRGIYEIDAIAVWAVDGNGAKRGCGKLCWLDSRGLHLAKDIDPALGFPLDEKGRLKIL